MKPLPETVETAREIGLLSPGADLLLGLVERSDHVLDLVPDCVGLSVVWWETGVAMTFVASDEDIDAIDAIQRLVEGPSTVAVRERRLADLAPRGPLDEDRWRLLGRATAARGVASTLTFPLTEEGHIVGSTTLYAGAGRAFEGHHDQLADLLGESAADATTNADLRFTTRDAAVRTPDNLRARAVTGIAVGLLMAQLDLDAAPARDRLDDAAARAGITTTQFATALVALRD